MWYSSWLSDTTNSPQSDRFSPNESPSAESVYQFYTRVLIPAIMSSLPLLANRILVDVVQLSKQSVLRFIEFVSPKWGVATYNSMPTIGDVLQNHLTASHAKANFADFMLRHFDADGDGHISSSELLNLPDLTILQRAPETWAAWFSREWPLMDWKIGVFVYNSFGGILILLAIMSVLPGRMHGWSARILRWPVLGLTYFLISVELVVYIIIRCGISMAEYLIARPKHRKLRQLMKTSRSYEEWYTYATQLDESQGRDKWLKQVDDETSYEYNWGFIQELIKDMRLARGKGDALLALAVIQQCTRKNVGGIMCEDLFSYSNTGQPKTIVDEFISEVVETLHWITDEAKRIDDSAHTSKIEIEKYEERLQRKVRGEKTKLFGTLLDATIQFLDPNKKDQGSRNSDGTSSTRSGDTPNLRNNHVNPLPSFHRNQVLMFLKRARAAYGRTAFCMSGGAMLGLYHFGVVLALLEAGCLPHIISGTSAGSVIGAIICTRTDEELKKDLQPHVLAGKICCFKRPWNERIKSVLRNGCMFDVGEWMDLIQWFSRGSTTFLEAYHRTGRIFCITLSSTSKKSPPVLLNYLTAPNVTIASAVIASAAVPGFVPPVRLQIKLDDGTVRNQGGEKEQAFWDGSIQQDIPTQGLSEMLNCQFFIASQCNPHIIPFFFNRKGGVGNPSRWSSGTQETSYRGGFLLSALEMYLKNDMKAKMTFLDQVDAAVGPISTMFSQEFLGSTTIVPSTRPLDYTKLFTDPRDEELDHYFQAGARAAYEHIAMIKLHYKIADAIEECVDKLEGNPPRAPRTEGPSQRNRKFGSAYSDDWMDIGAQNIGPML